MPQRFYFPDDKKKMTNISCEVYRNGDQVITTATDTLIEWIQEFNDPTNMHDNSTDNTKIKIATAGIYLVTSSIRWVSNSTGVRRMRIKGNGSNLSGSYIPADGNSRQSCSIIVKLAATDYIEVEVYHNRGSNLSVDNLGGTHLSVSLIATT